MQLYESFDLFFLIFLSTDGSGGAGCGRLQCIKYTGKDLCFRAEIIDHSLQICIEKIKQKWTEENHF